MKSSLSKGEISHQGLSHKKFNCIRKYLTFFSSALTLSSGAYLLRVVVGVLVLVLVHRQLFIKFPTPPRVLIGSFLTIHNNGGCEGLEDCEEFF